MMSGLGLVPTPAPDSAIRLHKCGLQEVEAEPNGDEAGSVSGLTSVLKSWADRKVVVESGSVWSSI